MRNPAVTATLWGGAGLLAGAGTGALLLLPFRPRSAEGFAELGWFLAMLALAALLGLIVGAVLLHRGLRRSGAAHAGRTALVFVPLAVLLGAVTAGAGALAAPAAAHWVVEGFVRRPAGWGPPRPGGLPQRLVVAVVVSGALATWGLSAAGHELGGRVGGVWLTWAAVLPAVVLPPVLLLRRVLPWRLLAAGVVAAAVLLGVAAPAAVRDAHPTPGRLEQIALDLPVPDGQEVTDVRTTVLRDVGWEVPVTLLSTAGPVPPLVGAPAARPAGYAAAEAWQTVLREQGWITGGYQDTAYWLPAEVQSVLQDRPLFERGLWVRAAVLPYGDGALVVLSVRP